jgi:plastocyanin
MRGHVIRRAMLVVGMGLLVSLVFLPEVAHSSGGGGCGRAVTDDDGDKVRISDFCFGPTILRIQPGETVTWVNVDPAPHTVLGANAAWGGFDSVRRNGGEVTYRFVRNGVYPYLCTIHVGMMGAVVVGNGQGRGAADTTTTAAGPVILSEAPVARSIATLDRSSIPGSESALWPSAIGLGTGVALAVAAAIASSRKRRGHGTSTN